MQIRVRDEVTFRVGIPATEFVLGLPSAQTTVRELIQLRVEHEVALYNSTRPARFAGLVQPLVIEQQLNGDRPLLVRQLDPARQVARALELFASNGFFLLIDQHQLEDLDDQIIIGPATVVTFLKLTPLVGG